jgi:cellobiose phosphorylase
LTSLIAIARGEVTPEHWQALGRPFGLYGGKKVLFSWSGSMFEYLMPVIFTRTFENSLLDHACREAVAAHIEYARSRRVPWGISESAFSALDSNRIYQYRAFGVPALGLKRGLEEDLVIAPYATALALMVKPVEAVGNLKALERAGLHGPRGFYEAIDYSRESREGTHGAVVYAYMAHHQGMSFLAMNNALCGNRMQRRFHADLRVRAAESLLYEGIPPSRIVSYLNTNEERPPARLIALPSEGTPGRSGNEKTRIPKVHLLSNGSYSLMITNSGGGYSRWRDIDITRWRADTTRDHWGAYCYIRDLDNGDFWSAAHHPAARPGTDYSVTYYSDRVKFMQGCNGIESIMEVAVSPEDDAEVRRIVLVNRSERRRRLDLTTYSELALAPHAADRAHPAFNKLFIQTEILHDRSALLAFRQSGAEEESRIWVGHLLASTAGMKAEFESSRLHFIGRGRDAASPAAMTRNLSNASGPVLDPILSIRKEVMLEPGEKVRLAALTLASDSRENVVRLIDRYCDLEAADRAFELSWTHSQLNFRYLRIQHEDARRFQELAARLIFPNALLRPGAERLRRNTLGQSRLWAFGISGDLPICVLVVSDPLDLGTVREILQAHSFWRERGLKSDLVILNTEAGGYEQTLQQKLIKLIQIYSVSTGTDCPGGVFLRSAEKLSGEDLTLLLSAAHVALLASRGSLGRQLSSLPEAPPYPPPLKIVASAPEEPGRPLPMPELTYFNGIGGFSPDGREYVTCLDGDGTSPSPWINVLANPDFGAIVNEAGQGNAWHLNSQLNRLTPWHNDPVAADSSSAVYVRDEDTGVFWCPSAAPIRESTPYRVYHGQGYTRIEHNSHGIVHDLVTFVPLDQDGGKPARVQRLELRNQTLRKRRLTVTFYTEWVLGSDREETQLHVISNWDPVSSALLARNAYNSEYAGQIAFAAARPAASTYTADRAEFLGRNGMAADPAALRRRFLSGRTGAALDPCAALQVRIDLDPGEKTEIAFLLGQAENIQEARTVIDSLSDSGKVNESFAATAKWWDALLGAIQVHTPERSADILLNRWLLYQTLSCRVWGRSALYQSGGAFGFRDQLQDVMALVYARPEIAREQILRAAGRQFLEGDVQHWWHPQSGAGVRTRCSDDLLWLPYAAFHYVRVTGDHGILEERIPFLESQPLAGNEMEVYSTPSISMTDGTLFEHCRRAIERGFTAGAHGLPLIGLCDWNDGYNRVGVQGKGESVWLAWFLIDVLRGYRELCVAAGQHGPAELCDLRIKRLESAVEISGWDGEWYRRAYFDDGLPLGSHLNQECRIDSLAQSWSVISGSAPPNRAVQALKAVEEHLVRNRDRLVLLFTPPFQHSNPNPGYVGSYPPGVRENGGQYTHAAAWVAMAFARQGNGKRAVELLRMLNPIELTASPAGISRYRCEPYVLAGDVYSLEGRVGQGGWTWYTGSSAWVYRVWIEEVLGFRLRGNTLAIDPVIPAQWPGFEISYVYGNSKYRIRVENPEWTGRGIAWLELDGRRLPGETIPLRDDGREHEVRVQLGRLKNAINY